MKALGLISLLVLILSGCASFVRYRIHVDSVAFESSAVGASYVLVSVLEGEDEINPQGKEFSNYVNQILMASGFVESTDFETADLAIFLSYGIGEPQTHHYEYSLPVRGQTDVPSFTRNSTVQSLVTADTVNRSTFSPPKGVADYRQHAGTHSTFLRFVMLDAMDLREYRESGSISPVWRTTITSTGSSEDLNRIFPALLAAGGPYIGGSTDQQVTVSLSDSDDRVQEIRSSLAERQ